MKREIQRRHGAILKLTPFLLILLLAQMPLSYRAFAEDEAAPAEAPVEAPVDADSAAAEAPAATEETAATEEPAAVEEATAQAAPEEAGEAETAPEEKTAAAAKPSAAPAAPIDEAERAERKSGVIRLLKKLKRENGENVPIGVLTPLDYTTTNQTDVAQETILSSIARYGEFDLRSIVYSPASLTLEEFRKVVTKYKVDVVILAVLKPTNFDLFLYDRRVPYQIFAHSETLPEEVQYQISREIVEEYTKVIVRRTLYAYMQDQYYELPREEARPLLSAEVPRWIASARNLQMVNRELLSSFYASVSVGAALSNSSSGFWNSNLVGLQGAMRVSGNLYGEAFLDMFAYNAVGVGVKYHFGGKDFPFRFLAGLGGATLINRHTLNWDQTFGQGLSGNYIVPSAAFMLPIVDIYFKVESKVYIDTSFSKFIFVVMPGLFVML